MILIKQFSEAEVETKQFKFITLFCLYIKLLKKKNIRIRYSRYRQTTKSRFVFNVCNGNFSCYCCCYGNSDHRRQSDITVKKNNSTLHYS